MTTQVWRSRIVGYGTEAADQLLANPKNWRVHPKAQQDALAGVLDEVGWVQNILVNQRTGYVIDGHARVGLAISRGETEVPVTYVDLSDEEEALILASLDPLAAMAGTDKEKQAALMLEVAASSARFAELMAGIGWGGGIKEGLSDPDDVPATPAEPTTKPGDLWVMGEHRLLCGDATKPEAVARLCDGRKATIMWTDPPYGVNYVGKTKDALTIANDDDYGLSGLLSATWAAVTPVMEEGAPFYIARAAGALGIVFGRSVEDAGWHLHEELQWVKDTMVLGHSDYHYKHETIMYGWLPGPGHSGRGNHEGTRWYGGNAEVTVFEIARPKASPDHPTGKPVALVERHLANSSRLGEVVLEPFAGSGTTIIAGERLGRGCYAMEIDPRYVDVCVRRWENFSGQKAVLG